MNVCGSCRTENPTAAKHCNGCGAQLAAQAAASRDGFGRGWWIIMAVAGIPVILMLVGISSTPAPPPRKKLVIRTGNQAHDMLTELSAAAQAVVLAEAVRSTGDQCDGQRAFFMGLSPADNEALWSIQCSGGKAYEVSLAADSVGSSKVLDCETLRTLAKVNCFEKLR